MENVLKVHFLGGMGKHTANQVRVFSVPRGQFRKAFEHLNYCIPSFEIFRCILP